LIKHSYSNDSSSYESKKLISFQLTYHKLTFYLQKALGNNLEPNRPQLFRLMYSCVRSLIVLRLTKDLKLKTMYSCIRSLLVLRLTKDLKLKTMYSCVRSLLVLRLTKDKDLKLKTNNLLSSPQNLFRPLLEGDTLFEKGPYVPPTIMKK
jgi:hypothetical protein